MVRVVLFLAVLSGLFAGAVRADDTPLKRDEIIALLAGNTAVGHWRDDTYRQWFAADGGTIYAPKGKRSSVGRWRVSSDGQYESWWSGPTWERFGVVRDGDVYFWVEPDGTKESFTILAGQQLVWPD